MEATSWGMGQGSLERPDRNQAKRGVLAELCISLTSKRCNGPEDIVGFQVHHRNTGRKSILSVKWNRFRPSPGSRVVLKPGLECVAHRHFSPTRFRDGFISDVLGVRSGSLPVSFCIKIQTRLSLQSGTFY